MTIYISNLGFNVEDGELKQIFEGYGEVSSAKVIIDRHTGRSKGFGFVDMSDEDAQKAIGELDQTDYDGKTLNVSEARPRTEKPARSGGYGGDRRRSGGGYGGGGDRHNDRNNKRW